MNTEIKPELSNFMRQMADVQQQIKELKAVKEELRTAIMTMIKIADIEQYEDDENMLIYTKQMRKSFDKAKAIEFLAEHGEKEEDYFEESEYEMLKIKAKQNR